MPEVPRESFGPFQVRGDLGSGRFGPVYRAEAIDTGEPVVVRPIRAALEPAQRQALVDALRWLCETPLDHPSLGRPIACGIEGETPYLVQAFVPGTPLDEFLDRRGPQPVDDTLVRLTQLAGAIDFAAAAGVYHAALHRRAILLGAHHSAIVGVGLAQAAAQAGLLIEAHGAYQSPQQRAGEPPTAADDVYALAVVALQLLCGRADDHDEPADLLATLEEAGLAPELQAVFEAALAGDPGQRPPTALAFAARLQAALVPEATGTPGEAAVAAGGVEHAAGEPLADIAMRDGPDVAPVMDALHPLSSTGPIELPLLLEPDMRDPADPHGASRLDDGTWRGRGRPRRRGRPEDHSAIPADRLQLDGDREPAAPGRADEESRSPAPVPLPFDTFAAAPVAREASDTEPGSEPERWTDVPAAAAGPSSMGAGRAIWSDREAVGPSWPDRPDRPEPPPVDRRPWLLLVAAILVMAVAGVAVAWLATRSTESVPFPRSAATLPAAEPDGPVAGELPAAGGVTRIPDSPAIAPPVPLPDAPAAIAEPLDPPPLADPPAPAAPPVPAASDPALSPAASPPAQAQPPAPAPAEPGRILVRSTPAGAQVLVNGVPQEGTTPLPVRDLALGVHSIEVRHPQYAPRQERVTLTAEAPARGIDVDLDRPVTGAAPAAPASAAAARGALEVESRPAGAQVFVDDRLVGVTPLVVPGVTAGSRVVRLELPGYRRWTTSVTVAEGSRVRVAASLEP